MAIGENNCGFLWYVYCRVGSERLGATESLGGSVRLYCGGRVGLRKILNLTNFIPNGLRIIQRFTEVFRIGHTT